MPDAQERKVRPTSEGRYRTPGGLRLQASASKFDSNYSSGVSPTHLVLCHRSFSKSKSRFINILSQVIATYPTLPLFLCHALAAGRPALAAFLFLRLRWESRNFTPPLSPQHNAGCPILHVFCEGWESTNPNSHCIPQLTQSQRTAAAHNPRPSSLLRRAAPRQATPPHPAQRSPAHPQATNRAHPYGRSSATPSCHPHPVA